MAEISGPEFAYLVVHLGVWVSGTLLTLRQA